MFFSCSPFSKESSNVNLSVTLSSISSNNSKIMQVKAKALLMSFTKFDKPFFVPGHKANKSNALPSFLTGPYRPSSAALCTSTKSEIATGHFSFLDPPLQSQSNVYDACETESNILKKRIFEECKVYQKFFHSLSYGLMFFCLDIGSSIRDSSHGPASWHIGINRN